MASYLAKANPDIYDLDCFLDGPTKKTLWTVCKDAKLNNILYLAKCGKKAGIVAVARIAVKEPKVQKDDIGDPCWTKLGKASPIARESRWRAEIEILDKINIPENELERYPVLKNKLTWLYGQGTCCHLSEAEEDAIQALIKR